MLRKSQNTGKPENNKDWSMFGASVMDNELRASQDTSSFVQHESPQKSFFQNMRDKSL